MMWKSELLMQCTCAFSNHLSPNSNVPFLYINGLQHNPLCRIMDCVAPA